jgi:hypothetical protein
VPRGGGGWVCVHAVVGLRFWVGVTGGCGFPVMGRMSIAGFAMCLGLWVKPRHGVSVCHLCEIARFMQKLARYGHGGERG